MSDLPAVRYAIQARLLGQDKATKKPRVFQRSKDMEYAIEVVLSDESQYTIFRTVKDIASLHGQLVSTFPNEAGYFREEDRVIPVCPTKMTIFGPTRIVQDDRSFAKLLSSYIKELSAIPVTILKSDTLQNFFGLRASDIDANQSGNNQNEKTGRKKTEPIVVTEESQISGPVSLRSYYAVASFTDPKTKFNFSEGAVVQVIQKDASGWWRVDASGLIGWAPASYLVPVDEGDLQEEAEENEQLVGEEKVGARYISISSYQASRDDELSFVRGAVVRLIKKYIDGWWLVRYNGGEGFVPGALFHRFDKRQATAYVKRIKRNFISRRSTKIVGALRPRQTTLERGSHDGESQNLYQCMSRFKGSVAQSEISLNKNDVVKVHDKKDNGWWYVQDQHGHCGWAPATYLKPVPEKNSTKQGKIVGSMQTVMQPHLAQQNDELSVQMGDSVVVMVVSDDGLWMVRNVETEETGLVPSVCFMKEAAKGADGDTQSLQTWAEVKEEFLTTTEELSEEDKDVNEEEDNLMLLEECYVVIRDYTSNAIDELDVYEGQIVCVIDNTETDFWYVIADGKEGWLPSSTLKILTEEEVDSSSQRSSRAPSSASREDSHTPPIPPIDAETDDQNEQSDSAPVQADPLLLDSIPQLRRASHVIRRRHHLGGYKESGVANESASDVMVGGQTLDELEREAAEAERAAQEAYERAAELRKKAQHAKHLMSQM